MKYLRENNLFITISHSIKYLNVGETARNNRNVKRYKKLVRLYRSTDKFNVTKLVRNSIIPTIIISILMLFSEKIIKLIDFNISYNIIIASFYDSDSNVDSKL